MCWSWPRATPGSPGGGQLGGGGVVHRQDPLSEAITVTVFKVEGETNTDDLSPATHATTRPDIPLHAQAMLETRMPEGLALINTLKAKGHPLAYVGDVVGTGSSRKSAINSVLWHIGTDIPHVPEQRSGEWCWGQDRADLLQHRQDSGALPIECDVSALNSGDVITIRPRRTSSGPRGSPAPVRWWPVHAQAQHHHR